MRKCLCLLFALAALPTSASAQTAPWTSASRLVSTNGFAPVVYDSASRRVVSFRENMYRYPAPGQVTRDLAFDLYFGLRARGTRQWLTEVPLDEVGYALGTNLIRTVQRASDITITTTTFAPFTLGERAFVVTAELENRGAALTDLALFSLHNFHVGGGADQTQGERITWDAARGAYVERSAASPGALVVRPLFVPTHHTASPDNPFGLLAAGRDFPDVADSGVFDDAVSGFQMDVSPGGTFAAGARASFAMVVAWAPDGDASALIDRIDAWAEARDPAALLSRERDAWRSWHREGLWAGTVREAELNTMLTSLAVLRMGQVREPGPPHGQILASLPPGGWDIAWLRDGVFAIQALIATGHLDEAEAALAFFRRGPFGDYASYVGGPYGLTLARHYGNGREESDHNENGPNIELDGFGMFLVAAAELVAAGRGAWLDANASAVDTEVAEVLMRYRDPETGLVAADSSIWETHWDNGGRQRFTFTSGYAVLGLNAWADALEARFGVDARVERYRARANEILAGLGAHARDPVTGALAASVEQLRAGDGRFVDAQTALILNDRTFAASSATGLATLDLLEARLFLRGTTGRGYKRNDDGGEYDEREWAVIDLGMSRALRSASRTATADARLDWVTDQAALNFHLIPELYHQADARYFGEVPMVGFGAGAYLLALVERSGTAEAFPTSPIPDAGVADARADAGELAPDAGEADAGTPSPDAGRASTADASVAIDAGADRILQKSCSCDDGGPQKGAAPLVWLGLALACLGLRTRQAALRAVAQEDATGEA